MRKRRYQYAVECAQRALLVRLAFHVWSALCKIIADKGQLGAMIAV